MKHTVSQIELNSGLKGLLIDVPDASVMYTEINFRAGEYLLPEKKWETAHLMEHMLLGANDRFERARDFQAELEKNGAYSNASTGVYDITYESECADFEWQRVLELLLVAISKPRFLEEEFTAESGNVHEELVGRSNNHFRHLNIALRENMGMTAMTDQKRIEMMKHVTLSDISEHYKKTHTLQNARFILAGKMAGREREIEQIMSQFLSLPKGRKQFELPDEKPKKLQKPIVIRRSHVPNLYFYVDTYTNQKFSTAEKDAVHVASTLLTETLYSRILGKARERGLVYAMGSGQSSFKLCHGWWLGAQVSLTNAPVLFRLIRDELREALDGNLEQSEVQAAAHYLTGKYMRSGQTVAGIVAGYAQAYYLEDRIEDYAQFTARMQSVTAKSVSESLNKLFDESVWGMAGLGNVKTQTVRELGSYIAGLWSK